MCIERISGNPPKRLANSQKCSFKVQSQQVSKHAAPGLQQSSVPVRGSCPWAWAEHGRKMGPHGFQRQQLGWDLFGFFPLRVTCEDQPCFRRTRSSAHGAAESQNQIGILPRSSYSGCL